MWVSVERIILRRVGIGVGRCGPPTAPSLTRGDCSRTSSRASQAREDPRAVDRRHRSGGQRRGTAEAFVTKGGIYAYGTAPDLEDLYARQARELDRSEREVLLHPLPEGSRRSRAHRADLQQAFMWGVGPRVRKPPPGLIQGYAYVGPAEDLKLKP